MKRRIYLDNSMTSRPSPQAVACMLPYLTDFWGSPSAPHQMGHELLPGIQDALRSLYRLLEASPDDDIIFTSSGAEAVNQAILSTYFDVTIPTGKNHFVTSSIEEAPALMAIGRLEPLGCVGKMIKPNAHGQITVQAVAEAISPRTAMISLSWANALTGVIHPVAEIGDLCRERGILFHLDATHVLGKLFFDLNDLGAHLISFNGDQIHAPKGTGALYIKAGTKCSPLITGGIEQNGRRAGPFSVAALASLGFAAREAAENRDFLCTEIARLRNKLEEGLLEQLPDCTVFFRDQDRLPNSTAIAFPGVANEALLYALNRHNLLACIGGGTLQQISLLLIASNIPEPLAHTAINFTLSRDTSDDDVEQAIEIICFCTRKLRKISGPLTKANP